MPEPCALLKFVGKALGNAIGGGIAGDLLIEVLPEVTQNVWAWWSKDRNPEERRKDVEQVAGLTTGDVRPLVDDVLIHLPSATSETKNLVETYLTLVPGAFTRSLKLKGEPTGKTVPPGVRIEKPEDLLEFLPTKLPRFKPDHRIPGIDLELVELLGVGGFGEVWKARNPLLDGLPPVALKFCLDPSAKDRLLKHEAAILAQVMRHGRHEGIVQLLHTCLSVDPPYLAYEFVEGGDLAGMIRNMHRPGHQPTPADVTPIILRLAEIVGFAHRLNPPIVHRDLKPANILVQRLANREQRLKVADFGIGGVAASQAIQEATRGLSPELYRASVACGSFTPLYASREQMAGKPPDPRDDVFALGVIWHQLLTGDLNEGMPGGSAWRMDLLSQGMPDMMVQLLESCFERLEKRPADAATLAERLTAIVRTEAPPGPSIPPRPPEKEVALSATKGTLLPRTDAEYVAWLKANLGGFVVSTNRRPAAKNMVLRRASCKLIGEARPDAEPGGFTERQYIKVCASDVESLRAWVAANGRPDRTFSKECGSCKPTADPKS